MDYSSCRVLGSIMVWTSPLLCSLFEQEKLFNPLDDISKHTEYWWGVGYRQTDKKMPRKGMTTFLREGCGVGFLVLCQGVFSKSISIYEVRRVPFSIKPLPEPGKAGDESFCGVNIFQSPSDNFISDPGDTSDLGQLECCHGWNDPSPVTSSFQHVSFTEHPHIMMA